MPRSKWLPFDAPVPKDNVTDWGSTRPPMPRYPRNRVAYWWTGPVWVSQVRP